jgi:hypothetical protein
MFGVGDFHQLPLRPEDLSMLQRIFDSEVDARHLRVNSEQAENLARKLIELFQSGIRREDALREHMQAA